MLINKDQKKIIQRIYKYMDKSEDGAITEKELAFGYKAILRTVDIEQNTA